MIFDGFQRVGGYICFPSAGRHFQADKNRVFMEKHTEFADMSTRYNYKNRRVSEAYNY